MTVEMFNCIQEFLGEGIYTVSYAPADGAKSCVLACMPLGDERRHVSRTVNDFLKICASDGICGAMFDYPGMGESSGSSADCSLESSLEAGLLAAQYLQDRRGVETFFVTGVRSGSFCAVKLSLELKSYCILWQPFLTGRQFLRELRLKEKVRGAIIGKEGEEYLLNAEPLSEELRNSLEEFEGLPAADNSHPGFHVLQVSPSSSVQAGFKALPRGTGFSHVRAEQFWNPHDGHACVPVIETSRAIINGVG